MPTSLKSLLGSPVYHGSITANITSFNPFSHFGSRDAALAAASAKYFSQANRDEVGTLYQVILDLSEADVVEVEDFGNPNPLSLLRALANLEKRIPAFAGLDDKRIAAVMHKGRGERSLGRANVPDTVEKFTNEANAMAAAAIDQALKAAQQAAGGSGAVKALVYKNDVEGGDDEMSVCVLVPAVVRLVKVEPLTSDDLKQAWCLISPERQDTLPFQGE